ncbi:alpha/beta hydrolase [Mycobacterium sp. E2733]|uniref:alpha/beta hydrolase n=1 Tax=Mycobacterium sp. E2733 TaxID=1834138 RepID=UPI000AC0911C|nr:alpha/beta hydrolase [Mycobacterium sp. E2733]
MSFESGGVPCAADLYRPAKAGKGLACVVMGHGGSATKRLGLPAYAAKFTAAGLAVLAFDYRHFGASGGEPRQVIDVAEQRDDYRAAVRYVRGREDIDPHRVALWGTSLSGSHVLAVAATDPEIAAVVLQVPLIDGWHRGRRLRERLSWDVTWRTLQFTVAALCDVIGAKLGRPPYLVPVVADPGEIAVFTEPEAKSAFEALGGEAVGWRNALAPRMLFALPRYHEGTAEKLRMPVLMCVGDRDLQASPRFAVRIASGMNNVELHRYPVGHFDVYTGALFEEISAVETEFLRRHLIRDG